MFQSFLTIFRPTYKNIWYSHKLQHRKHTHVHRASQHSNKSTTFVVGQTTDNINDNQSPINNTKNSILKLLSNHSYHLVYQYTQEYKEYDT